MAQAVRSLALVLGLLAGGLVAGPGAGAAEAGDSTGQQRVIDRARLSLEAFLDDPRLEIRPYVQNAYGVLIIPELLRGGLIIGAEHGIGVLLSRDVATGAWSPPAFYALYGGSIGLQFGGKTSDAVYTIMNEAALLKLMSAKFKLGADAGVAVGRTGAAVGAATTASLGEDIYAFSKDKGLFGGLAIDGSVVVPKHDWNRAYYGRPATPEEILRARHVDRPGTHALRETLARFDGAVAPGAAPRVADLAPEPTAAAPAATAPPRGLLGADAGSSAGVGAGGGAAAGLADAVTVEPLAAPAPQR